MMNALIDQFAQAPNMPKTLVVGLGVTGLSVARHLHKRGRPFAVIDSREQPPGIQELQSEMPDVPVFLGAFDAELFEMGDRLIVSPGIALSTPEIKAAIESGAEVMGDIELFARAVNAPVVAITGSNGKSTVTTLVGEMAKAAGRHVAVGGNLGIPALDLIQPDVDLYVLELSSFQLESTHSLAPAVSCVLNIQADHMDRYDSIEDYAEAKATIYRHAMVGIRNADDPRVMAMLADDEGWTFSNGKPTSDKSFGIAEHEGEAYFCRGELPFMPVSQLRIPGKHNQANALAALAIGCSMGFPPNVMAEVLREFPGLPHRTQYVAEKDGVRWYNDSKATNVGATAAALLGLYNDQANAVVLLGGDCKGADLTELTPILDKTARAVVLMGRDAKQIAAVIPSSCEVRDAENMQQAVELAHQLAKPGDHVLLSPACASLDQYKNFSQRGEMFVAAVRRLLS
jgi:UDP-N-acetylmuramoylalanine--D-glutamate ligase